MVTLNPAQLSQSVQRRIIESADANSVRVRLELRSPLTADLRAALQEEVAQLAAHPVEGLVAPRSVQVTARQITFELDPIHEGAVRLSDLFEGLDGRPMGDGLAAALTATAAQLCHKIHLSPGVGGHIRLHGHCHPGNLILTPMGTVALLGTGLNTIDALLLPANVAAQIRHTAPEVAAGTARDPRSDVYGLGVLFLTLLSGQTPWADSSPESHRQSLANRQLRNPGVSLQDPRPSLVELLKRSMAPEPAHRYATALAFGQAISTELKASGKPRADGAALQRLLSDAMPKEAKRGALILGDAAPPATSEPAPALSLGAWSEVLGDAQPPPQPSIPAPPEPTPQPIPKPQPGRTAQPAPRLSLPPASGPAPATTTGALTGDLSALDALYDEDVPNSQAKPGRNRAPRPKAPNLDDDRPSPRNTLLAGAGIIAAICVIWLVLRDAPPEPTPGPEVATAQADAEPAPAPVLPKAPDPAPKPPAPKTATNPRSATGYLTVFSTPTGATVLLDGGYVGKTPLVLKHKFEDRIYELKLVRDAYLPWEKVVRPSGETKSINEKAILEREP